MAVPPGSWPAIYFSHRSACVSVRVASRTSSSCSTRWTKTHPAQYDNHGIRSSSPSAGDSCICREGAPVQVAARTPRLRNK